MKLRSYNGRLVGETIRASPGDTLYLRIENNLPQAHHDHPHGSSSTVSADVEEA